MIKNTPKIVVLIAAAGGGTRFGSDTPKQFVDLDGRPLLAWSIKSFNDHPLINRVGVIVDPSHQAHFMSLLSGDDRVFSVHGGPSRQASVKAGLERLAEDPPDYVLIHDGARPFISHALISNVIKAVSSFGAVIPVLPVTDTLKQVEDGMIEADQDRNRFALAQTPQAFRFEEILNAHRKLQHQPVTDDAALITAAGGRVHTISGDPQNIKITWPDDMERENKISYRTGIGFDVHALVSNRKLILCGVEIPFALGLDGHSDADVGLHAITDAIFGLTGDGDIGSHFPPTDPKWKNQSSDRFLVYAHERLRKRGGTLEHVDLILICEKPKISNYRAAMKASLARLLELDDDQISVKGTTSEKLGFTGRGEGIAAQAAVSARIVRK